MKYNTADYYKRVNVSYPGFRFSMFLEDSSRSMLVLSGFSIPIVVSRKSRSSVPELFSNNNYTQHNTDRYTTQPPTCIRITYLKDKAVNSKHSHCQYIICTSMIVMTATVNS